MQAPPAEIGTPFAEIDTPAARTTSAPTMSMAMTKIPVIT